MQLEHLLEDLLLAARVDAGPMSQEAIMLSAVAATAVQGIAPFAASRSVRIWNEIDTPALVAGDRKLLDRVFLSLFHNAVKFAPEHGNVWISARLAGEYVECTLCDDGPGFSQEALLHAFDRFWRGDDARDNNGTGLGLAIAKTAIDRLHGEIHIQNSTFGGAKVTISLPILSSNHSHDTHKKKMRSM
jgi:signal transduction histidine kinase